MTTPTDAPAEVSLFLQVSANFLGGVAVTALWWIVTLVNDRLRLRKELQKKRESAVLEIARIRAALILLKNDPDRAASPWPARSAATLAALVRLGPSLLETSSVEPALADLENRLQRVDLIASHYHLAVSGTAQALRGNEQNVEDLREELVRLIEAANRGLSAFEKLVVGGED